MCLQVLWTPCPCKHTVTVGETGSGIAGALWIGEDELAALNPGVDLSKLLIGQVLAVPCSTNNYPGTRKLLRRRLLL